ncbi:terminase small subunit [Salmonella enterica]|nr:terminase small subunit [Salmonella enterica subsp. diarizonae]EGV3635457.1 terminase small subunit [Salmonella enterica]EKL0442665.1 terminase small subunit [Salmonella enterica]HCM1889061.1 terminase small subunit [Salmonella enterica subsp. diarizonae serovar 57:c:z]
MAKLSKKQAQFCQEYILDLNGTQAAIRAGYSRNAAQGQASRLLSNAMVKSRIAELIASRNERVRVDADHVLQRLVEIDQMDIIDILNDDMSIKPVSEWPQCWRRYIVGFDLADMFEGKGEDRKMVGILKKIKWPDKVKNLELLGRHVDVQAFKDRVECSGEVNLADRIQAARKRARHPETAQLTAQNETDRD